jgi:hypothetical protein
MRLGTHTLLAALALISLATPAAAHDFWVQPKTYWPDTDAATPLTLQVGHGPERQRSAIRRARIAGVFALGPDGRRLDLGEALQPGGADDGRVRLAEAVLHVLALETDSHAESHQPAARFNAYLVDEGLTPAIEARRRLGRTEVDGAERYGRVSKALIQVGPVDAASQRRERRAGPVWPAAGDRAGAIAYAPNRATDLPVRVSLSRPPPARRAGQDDRPGPRRRAGREPSHRRRRPRRFSGAVPRRLAAERGVDPSLAGVGGGGFRDPVLEPQLRLSRAARSLKILTAPRGPLVLCPPIPQDQGEHPWTARPAPPATANSRPRSSP